MTTSFLRFDAIPAAASPRQDDEVDALEPPVPGGGVVRDRLLERLRVDRVFIIAPAGAGKSTLLRHFSERLPRGSARSLRLEDQHTDPGNLDSALRTLLESSPRTILLDDAHRAFDGRAGDVLERFLISSGVRPRLVVAGRRLPRFPLDRAELAGHVVIGGRELAFRLDELLRIREPGLSRISLETAGAILDETGGWPLAVGMLSQFLDEGRGSASDAQVLAALRNGTWSSPLSRRWRDELGARAFDILSRASTLLELTRDRLLEICDGEEADHALEWLAEQTIDSDRDAAGFVIPPVMTRELLGRLPPGDRRVASERISTAQGAGRGPRATTVAAQMGNARKMVRAAAENDPEQEDDQNELGDADLAAVRTMLVGGDVIRAVRSLRRLEDSSPSCDPSVNIVARIALVVIRAPIAGHEATVTRLLDVERDATARGLTRPARIARGIFAAVSRAPESERHVREACEAFRNRGDPVVAAAIEAVRLLTDLRNGRGDVARALELALRFDAAQMPEVSIWLRAASGVLDSTGEGPALSGRADHDGRALGLDRIRLLTSRPSHPSAGAATDRTDLRELGLALPRLPLALRAALVPPAPAPRSISVGDSRAPTVGVTCFGGFRLRIGPREVDLGRIRPQARTVLRMLAVNVGSPVHREFIAEIIWGELAPDSAMHALHVSVSNLRRALASSAGPADAQAIERRGEAYALRLEDRRLCDLGDFDDSLSAASDARARGDIESMATGLRHAVARYAGEVLPEEGPAEWVVGARERYRGRASEAAASLALLELRLGDPGAAVAAAERAVEIDPWTDSAWRALMTVHADSGDPIAARRAERGYRRMLTSLELA